VAGTVHPGFHHGLGGGLAAGYVLAAQVADPGGRRAVPGGRAIRVGVIEEGARGMSALKAEASSVRELFAATGLQPAPARSTLTSASTVASAAVSADTVTGAVVSGVLVGSSAGFDGVAVSVGSAVGFFEGVVTGGAVEVEGAAEGVASRSAPRLVPVSSRLSSALPEVPPCGVSTLDGEPAACTLSALPPPRE